MRCPVLWLAKILVPEAECSVMNCPRFRKCIGWDSLDEEVNDC